MSDCPDGDEIWTEITSVNVKGNLFAKKELWKYNESTIEFLIQDMFEKQACSLIPTKYSGNKRTF